MRVINERPDDNFTQITNEVLRDERISDMARGVLVKMLSYADGWSTTADRMWKRAAENRPWDRNGAGRRAYRSAFSELERAGYLQRERLHGEGGRFETVLILRNRPAHWDSIAPVTESEDSPATGIPEPAHRNRGTGNGRSETGTSSRTLEHQTLSSGADAHGLRRRRPRSKQREHDTATIILEVRIALDAYYGRKAQESLSDGEVWQLWEALRGDRPESEVGDVRKYLSTPFGCTPELDTLRSKYIWPDDARWSEAG